MDMEPSSVHTTAAPRDTSPRAWLHARALWAGLSIITMWLAVLFVGIFGGDFISSNSANGFTKIPVVIFVLPFVLPATIVIGRRGFMSAPDEQQLPTEEEPRAHEDPTPERSTMRAKPA